MDSTSASLLKRLREPSPESAWSRFVELYAPLIFYWGRKDGMSPTDAGDVVQEVLAILVVKLPEFEYDPSQRFRGWLRTVTVNKAKDIQRRDLARSRANTATAQMNSMSDESSHPFEESEYQTYVVRRAFQLMQTEFEKQTWRACWQQVVEGASALETAQDLDISVNAARIAKSRVLRRLREELDGLLG
jgi:RNA polymerase sigma-70 factor (ECF subfamily)